MEASHCLQATEPRESWTHESDPQDTLAKLCQETQLSWVDILPLVLLWASAPWGPLAILPLISYMGEGPQWF